MLIEAISTVLKPIRLGRCRIYHQSPKSIYLSGMLAQNVSFDEVYDKFALRYFQIKSHDGKYIQSLQIITDVVETGLMSQDGAKGRWVRSTSSK
jgi:hypothetical protein